MTRCCSLPFFYLLPFICLALGPGCNDSRKIENGAKAKKTIRIATTTSTRDSGLMDALIPEFEKISNAKVKLIAVGTGKALELGRQGEVDALLVHSKEQELEFVRRQFGVSRTPVMYNFFELLGPTGDPAEIKGRNPVEALHLIRQTKSTFVSRGDKSGTHDREQDLWSKLESLPRWPKYLETGQGMGASLMIADQKEGYILCDRGTYLAMQHKIKLVPLALKTNSLKNTYSVIVVSQNKARRAQTQLAEAFSEFMTSKSTQNRIASFQIDGEPLFHPLSSHPLRNGAENIDNKLGDKLEAN